MRASRETSAKKASTGESPAGFELVSEERVALKVSLVLALVGGSRFRIGRGVDEETLRTVLAAVETAGRWASRRPSRSNCLLCSTTSHQKLEATERKQIPGWSTTITLQIGECSWRRGPRIQI